MNAMEILATCWARPEFTALVLRSYEIGLADIPADELDAAVGYLFRTHEGDRPQVARIRRLVAEARQAFPVEAEAVRQAKELAVWRAECMVPLGANGSRTPRPVVHPAVEAAFEAAGVDHQPSFLAAYRQGRERIVKECQAGPMDRVGLDKTGTPMALEDGK